MIYLPTRNIPIPNPIIFANNPTTTNADDACWMFLYVAIHKISAITIRSWTISIPMLNLPDVDSNSSLSHKSFSTTIVLLKANHTAKKLEVIPANHNIVAKKYHNQPVIAT